MKKLLLVAVAGILFQAAAIAQSVTLRFEGSNANSGNEQNFTVDIDGTRYYSFNAEARGSRARVLDINEIPLGAHTIKVYRNNTNTTISSTGTQAPLYSNAFQLRSGYDMVISIRRNGQVSFSEKRTEETASTSNQMAMTDAKFNTLLQSVKAKWSQSSRYTAVKSAFNTKTNYFTTDQAGQLLMQITSEAKKLELAKLSYPRITDPENFIDVTELFNAQASKTNIEQFIQSKNAQTNTGYNTSNTGSVSTAQFNQLLRTVKNQYLQPGKYAVIRDAFNEGTTNYTTAQIRQLLTLITAESDKLALVKLAYPRVSDAANFTTLYSLFNTQANRDEFNNFIRYGGTTTTTTNTSTTGNPGQYSHRIAMSELDFSRLQMKVRLHFRQTSVVEDVKEAFTNKENYFSIEQTRALLTYVTNEAERLAIAKLAYHRVTDPAAYTQLFDLFTSQMNKDELSNYIRTNPS